MSQLEVTVFNVAPAEQCTPVFIFWLEKGFRDGAKQFGIEKLRTPSPIDRWDSVAVAVCGRAEAKCLTWFFSALYDGPHLGHVRSFDTKSIPREYPENRLT